MISFFQRSIYLYKFSLYSSAWGSTMVSKDVRPVWMGELARDGCGGSADLGETNITDTMIQILWSDAYRDFFRSTEDIEIAPHNNLRTNAMRDDTTRARRGFSYPYTRKAGPGVLKRYVLDHVFFFFFFFETASLSFATCMLCLRCSHALVILDPYVVCFRDSLHYAMFKAC